MSKKFFIITGIILVLLVIGLAGYYFVFIQNQNTDTVSTTIQKTFNPFGQSDTTNSTTTDNTNNTTGSTAISSNQNDYTKKLREIWNQPVSGAGILDEKLGSTVSFVDKATGFVYKTELFSANQIRLSNTTIPLAYNAVWDGQNNSFVAQYLKDDNTVSTNVLSLKSSTTTDQTISGFSLGENIKSVSVYGENIFYLQTYSDISKGFISTIDGKTKKQIWQSPLSELNSQIIDNAIVLTTKPYQNTAGFSYLINTTTGGIKKIIGNIDGLVTLTSNDASTVLYSSQNDFGVYTFLYNTKTNKTTNISPVTFPEKCVWSKKDINIVYCAVPESNLNGDSLISWYIGNISFRDDIWKYDLKNNTAVIIDNLTDESGIQIDVIKPQLSVNEKYLVFINKIDGTLWSLDLTK